MGKFVVQNEENCDTERGKIIKSEERDREIFMRCSLHIYDFLVHFLIVSRVIAYFLQMRSSTLHN